MSDKKPSRGFQGTVLKLMRAGDYELTVTGRREISPHYLRLSFNAGGMLDGTPLHPTMWIRMWFADGDKLHQRGYTLVDPNPEADTVDIEFALHDGVASRWAQDAQPGDTIEITVLGSNFTLPEPQPAGYVIVGDTASLPAINSLLDGDRRCPGPGLPGGRPRRRQATAGRPQRRRHLGGPQERRRGAGRRRSARRRSTPRTISAGWPVTTGPPARSPRCFARTTTSRANPLRRRPTGWPDGHRR